MMKGHSLGLFGIGNKCRLAVYKLLYSQVSVVRLELSTSLDGILPVLWGCTQIVMSEMQNWKSAQARASILTCEA